MIKLLLDLGYFLHNYFKIKFVAQIHLPIGLAKHTSHVCQVILENKEIRRVNHIYLSFTNAKGWDGPRHGPKPILPKTFVLSRSGKCERNIFDI